MTSLSITVRNEEDPWFIEDIGDQCRHDFIRDAKREGGVWLDTHEGCTPFIPWGEITHFFFDDNLDIETEPDAPEEATA